jgi:hypothetical protein
LESSCKCGNETFGSIKCWKTIKWLHNSWPLLANLLTQITFNSQCQNRSLYTNTDVHKFITVLKITAQIYKVTFSFQKHNKSLNYYLIH